MTLLRHNPDTYQQSSSYYEHPWGLIIIIPIRNTVRPRKDARPCVSVINPRASLQIIWTRITVRLYREPITPALHIGSNTKFVVWPFLWVFNDVSLYSLVFGIISDDVVMIIRLKEMVMFRTFYFQSASSACRDSTCKKKRVPDSPDTLLYDTTIY